MNGTVDGSANAPVVELSPTYFLQERVSQQGTGNGNPAVALIILNTPISDVGYLRKLYNNASLCVCADAGADRLHDILLTSDADPDWQETLKTALPNVIHGDLDSISKNVRQRYESLGVDISEDPDQYSTDFGKAINKVIERVPDVEEILVLGSLGGRIDQGVGLLHELYREQKFRHPEIRLWLFSETNVTVMLRPGKTVIHTRLGEGLIERNVGILPVYGPAAISTQGLEWDVDDWKTEMGGQVSTSNHIIADQISITTDAEVLFTVERRVESKP